MYICTPVSASKIQNDFLKIQIGKEPVACQQRQIGSPYRCSSFQESPKKTFVRLSKLEDVRGRVSRAFLWTIKPQKKRLFQSYEICQLRQNLAVLRIAQVVVNRTARMVTIERVRWSLTIRQQSADLDASAAIVILPESFWLHLANPSRAVL